MKRTATPDSVAHPHNVCIPSGTETGGELARMLSQPSRFARKERAERERRAARAAQWPAFGPGDLSAAGARGGVHCPGCRNTPPSDCAACGKQAIISVDRGMYAHTLTLCRACLFLLIAARREGRAEQAQHQADKRKTTTTCESGTRGEGRQSA